MTFWLVIGRIVLKKKLGRKSLYVAFGNNTWATYLRSRMDFSRF